MANRVSPPLAEVANGPSGDSSPASLNRTALKAASIQGVAVNIGSQAVKLLLQFSYQILIARLLLPADFGLAALAAPLISFIQLFADLGFSQATVQRPTISQGQLSFLFWVSAALGLVLTLGTATIAPLVGRFYGDARVTPVLTAYGCLFFIGGFYSQHLALLNRRLRFVSLAIIELVSFGAGAVAGLLAAKTGMGVWALLINSVATSLATLFLAWSVALWLPTRPDTSEARDLLHFGANLTVLNIFNFFARNLDNVLVGRFTGVVNLGYYDRAYKLCLLPFNQIAWPFSRVAAPLLSRTQEDPDLYRRSYAQLVQAMLLLTIPAVLIAIIMADVMISAVLGQRWAPVTPIFRILGLDALIAPINGSLGWLMVSQARTREMRNAGIFTSIIFVLAFLAGVFTAGARGVASGYVVSGAVELLVLSVVVSRRGPLDFRQLLEIIAPNLLCGGVVAGALAGLRPLTGTGLVGFGTVVIAAYGLFAVALTAFPRQRRLLGSLLKHGAGWLRLPARTG